MADFVKNVYKNCNKRNTDLFYIDNVHKGTEEYPETGPWHLCTHTHSVFICNPRNYKKN